MSLIEVSGDIKGALSKALGEGLITQAEAPDLSITIHTLVEHPELSDFFKEGIKALNECEIIDKNRLILRPDRIVIYGNKVSILDYKTGKRDSRYHQQLYAYADALSDMGYEVENRVIVYLNNTITTEFI